MLICIIKEYLLTLLYVFKSIQTSFRKIFHKISYFIYHNISYFIYHKKYLTNSKKYQKNLKQRSFSTIKTKTWRFLEMSRAMPNLHEASWVNDSTRKYEPLYTITQYIVSSLRAFYLDSTAMMYTVAATYPF